MLFWKRYKTRFERENLPTIDICKRDFENEIENEIKTRFERKKLATEYFW
jgi:hypothetical protein